MAADVSAGATSEPLPWPVLDPMPAGWLGDTPARAVAVWRTMSHAERYSALVRARATARVWARAGARLRADVAHG